MGWGLERSAGSREESDGCDLVRLFLLERVDKNDRHKLPCEGLARRPTRLLTSMEGSLQPSDSSSSLTGTAPPNPGALPLHVA